MALPPISLRRLPSGIPGYRLRSVPLKPAVLCPGTLQDRDIGVRIFPKCEESLIGSFRLGLISRRSERFSELQMRQRADGIQPHDAAMIENLLKLGRCFWVAVRGNEGIAAYIGRVQTAKVPTIEVEAVHRQLIL